MTRLTFHLIPHTHWDREWYLPRAGFLARLVPAVGDVLDLLERDTEARFVLDGQTVLAEDALDVRPDWVARVEQLVSARRLGVGPWYVLADELIPTGESLVRNLLQGTRDASALGARMNVLYSPDAFGRPAILPMLANEFGIDTAVVWRGLGRPGGRDRDLYRWAAPDGSSVLLYHLPAEGYEIGGDLAGDTVSRWEAIREALVARAVTSHVAVFVGADHHAPPANVGQIRDAIQGVESGNFVRLSTLDEFFAAASPESAGAPSIAGELRWSYGHTWTLQGTHATRARLKRRHAAIELYLQRQVEPLATLAGWHRFVDQSAILKVAWRSLLQCQFHDTLCGCCSDLVADEQRTRLTSVASLGREVVRASLHAIAMHDPDLARNDPERASPALLLWNPVPRRRRGVAVAEATFFRRDLLVGPPSERVARTGAGYQPFSLVADDGRLIPVQVLSVTASTERVDAARHYPDQDEVDLVRVAFETPEIPGLGFAALGIGRSVEPAEAGLIVSQGRIENRFLSIAVSATGRVNLVDRRNGQRYADLLNLFDEADSGDSYTPYIVPGAPIRTARQVGTAKVIAHGPFVGAIEQQLRIESAARGELSVRAILILYADSPVLRIRFEIDNAAEDHRLRLRIPVGAGELATAGAPFGYERRAPVEVGPAAFPAERPPATAPAHRFVAAGDGAHRLALLSPGFFEYQWTSAGDVIATLLRSTGELSRNDLPNRPGHAGWPMATPDAQEPGRHVIDLAVAPLGESGDDEIGMLEQLWEELFLPSQSTFIRDYVGNPGALQMIGVTLEGAGLVFSALKVAENGAGLVLRCYNTRSSPVQGQWVFASAVRDATMIRADESPLHSIELADLTIVPFTAPPRGIVSILVTAQ